MERNGDATAAKVEHITKASSDELLSKFAEVSSKSKSNKLALTLVKKKNKVLRLATKRQKINRAKPDGTNYESSPLNSFAADRNSLLPPAANRRSSASIRIAKANVRARNLKNKSLLGTIQKVCFLTSL